MRLRAFHSYRAVSAGVVPHCFALFNEIIVVEAVVRCTDLGNELERGVHFVLGAGFRVAGEPREGVRAAAERVAAGSAERVPVGDGET